MSWKIIVDCDCDVFCNYNFLGHFSKDVAIELDDHLMGNLFEFKRGGVVIYASRFWSGGLCSVWNVTLRDKIPVETFTVKGISFDMITVNGGTFTMGSNEVRDIPPHQVTLTTYKIGKFPVTQKLWRAVLGGYEIGKIEELFRCGRLNFGAIGDNYPMILVNHVSAERFIFALNQITGRKFAIPTLAQWEFAAKGGLKSQGYRFAGSNNLDEVAWYYENSGNVRLREDQWAHDTALANLNHIRPVGCKKPNELGIYDMSGNCWELCSDVFSKSISTDPQINPTGLPRSPVNPNNKYGNLLTKRGGSVRDGSYCLLSSLFTSQFECDPHLYNTNVGLRLVLLD